MATFKVSRELISERELIEKAFCEGYGYALEEQREFGIKQAIKNLFKKKVTKEAAKEAAKEAGKRGWYKGAKAGIERGYQRGLENAKMKDVFKNMTTGQKAAAIAAAAGVGSLAVKGGLDIANGH